MAAHADGNALYCDRSGGAQRMRTAEGRAGSRKKVPLGGTVWSARERVASREDAVVGTRDVDSGQCS
jgi:hypothetical protein